MLEDNYGCMTLTTNPMTTGKTRHIDIRSQVIVNNKVVVLQWCATTDTIADALTKFSLPTTVHLKHAGRMLSGTYSGPQLFEEDGGVLDIHVPYGYVTVPYHPHSAAA
jgi:hypothetical protein